MSNDIDEDMKNKISTFHNEMMKKNTISDFCEKEGISETTFHKYKEHENKIQESIESDIEEGNSSNNEEENNNFEESYKPDNKKDENEDNEDEDNDYELIIG